MFIMSKYLRNIFYRKEVWLVPFILSAILVTVAYYDFLTFHVLAELFAIMIAYMLFSLAFNTIKFTKDYLFFVIACGYFWVASMDLLHTMTYPEMNLIFEGSTNTATQFWVATRAMEAFLLLFAAIIVSSVANARRIFILYALLSVLFSSIILMGYFPVTYVDGAGLTAFKLQSEHFIIITLAVSMYFYATKVKYSYAITKDFMIASLLLSIAAEFAFTAYVEFFGVFNLLGHIFKVFSFWMLYQALIMGTLISPHMKVNKLSEGILKSPLGMVIINLDGEIEICNEAYRSLMNNDMFTLVEGAKRTKIEKFNSWLELDEVLEHLKNGSVWKASIEICYDKNINTVDVVISPVVDQDENLVSALVVISDITGVTQANHIVSDKESAISNILVGSITAIASLLETRDPYTSGHSERVAKIAVEIAKELNLGADEIEGIRIAGLIHDIGKIKAPMEILNKPGKLSENEFAIIKEHPRIGYSVIKNIPFPWNVPEIVLSHHEQWQGGGYPEGLAGRAIPLGARILSVADVIEAITSHRPYRPSLGVDKAFNVINECKGKNYDPDVVEAATRVRSKISKILES